MSLSAISHFFIAITAGINPTCDFYQELTLGTEYYIYNVEYPNNYGALSYCRWIGKSPENSVIVMTCDIDIPESENCRRDHLSISLTGNSKLRHSLNFCGQTRKTLVTEKNSLAIGLFPSIWGFRGKFICSLTSIEVSSEVTTPPGPKTCDCGWTYKPRIVGGQDAEMNKYPSMAVIIDKTTGEGFCGASIISETYVLTAAHCLRDRKPEELLLSVGDYDLSNDNDMSVKYNISKFVIHPQYNESTKQDDIAVLQTAKPIVYTLYIGPVCLPFRYTWIDFYAQTVTALGWGFTDFSGNKADILQEVDLSIISNRDCASDLPDPISDKQICTFAPDKDTCLSDSGGPLLWQDARSKKLQLVGVISYGVGCATVKPAVNTRVTSYLTWIIDVTKDAAYCIQ